MWLCGVLTGTGLYVGSWRGGQWVCAWAQWGWLPCFLPTPLSGERQPAKFPVVHTRTFAHLPYLICVHPRYAFPPPDDDLRLARRIQRDVASRGRDVAGGWRLWHRAWHGRARGLGIRLPFQHQQTVSD